MCKASSNLHRLVFFFFATHIIRSLSSQLQYYQVPEILRHSNLGKRIHDTLAERYPGWPITWNKTKKHDEL